jgi:hypothetical protein
MIISFAWTTPALLAWQKTVTRREWVPSHAAKFHAGDTVDAYDKSPRAKGQKVGEILIAQDPYLEATGLMPDDDFEGEGFAYLGQHYPALGMNRQAFEVWKLRDETVWVVRFVLISTTDYGRCLALLNHR